MEGSTLATAAQGGGEMKAIVEPAAEQSRGPKSWTICVDAAADTAGVVIFRLCALGAETCFPHPQAAAGLARQDTIARLPEHGR